MNLAELKALWEEEKTSYSKKEIGTGVQIFIRNLFSSAQLFDLRIGKESTPDVQRRNEFLLEVSNQNGTADALIFIDADVQIPVEIEKFGHIESVTCPQV